MYKIVKYNREHVITLAKFSDKLPDISSPLVIIRASVKDEKGRIVGAGFIKLIGEAILVCNHNLDRKDRAEMINLLYQNSLIAAKEKGLDEINAFVYNDKSFVRFLTKLGFIETGATSLVKRL